MENGFIKLYRSLLKWEWIDNPNVLTVFIHCLLLANHQDNKWHGVLVERGTFITSISKLSQSAGLTPQQVRTALKKLSKSGEVVTKSQQGAKYTIIRVCNYEKFQDNKEITKYQQSDNKVITKCQQSDNKVITTNKNDKNVKNDKKDKKYYEHDALNQTFIDYVDMRKRIKAPMTDRAIQLAINKLNKLSRGDNDKAIKILEQSIMNSWKGLFELKEEKKANKFNNFEGRQYSNDQLEKMLGVNK